MSGEDIRTLAGHLQPVHYEAGMALCRTGDPPDRMWILKRGSVSVRVIGEHSSRRLASLGPGCSIGEMGLVEKKPRSADVVADEDVEAYLLTEDSFNIILSEQPRIGQALLASIARQLATRLRDTSEELRSLTH
jgi:SulP family sulfate permease